MTTNKVKTFAELETIAQSAQLVLAISGNEELTAFDIADLSDAGCPSLPEWNLEVTKHGRKLVGMVALTNGAVAAHLLEPLEAAAIEMLAAATVSHVSRRYIQAVGRLGLVSMQPAIESAVN